MSINRPAVSTSERTVLGSSTSGRIEIIIGSISTRSQGPQLMPHGNQVGIASVAEVAKNFAVSGGVANYGHAQAAKHHGRNVIDRIVRPAGGTPQVGWVST